jgi:microsomal epoxide hydrolase/non-specific protein-tyrosine kinase
VRAPLAGDAKEPHAAAMTTILPQPRLIDIGGVRLALREAGAGAPIVLVHGWPELSYSWKNQIGPLAEAGYRVLAPDLKGFGGSDAPTDARLYDSAAMTGDLARLLDARKIDRAIFCGHDWGGALVWPMAQLRPDRVMGVIGVCTPHKPPPPVAPMSIIEKRFGPKHYFVQFQPQGEVERLFETDVDRFFRIMFRRAPTREEMAAAGARLFDLPGRFRDGPPPEGAPVMSEEDLAVYVAAYRKSGFVGGVNLYRNVDRNWEIAKSLDPVIRKPALMISASNDAFLPPESADGIEAIVPDVERALVPDCGHWVMWEQPARLNAIMIDWLRRRFPAQKSA